ncbi:helix-turn-helix domain-containing protein [Nannocystis radixulma]|uniref:Short-chain fatty acyl-CoA regulator family protein n=1 Tax=Nannocystis radixulma TaxID=2995305 RepID=A0ABT5BJR2_9BACT|nr:helix-turn-helix transcriptional regulator [Nannocystis radixulma]MDC0673252.1 short-chain fatty acyl-CoA regulator family protein [Nannocystis radixulma]
MAAVKKLASEARDTPRFGAKIRTLRRCAGLSQAELAQRLDVSPSYLNLLEHDKRALPAPLLIKLARVLEVDLASFAGEDDARLVHDLLEVFSDPLFEDAPLTNTEVREVASASPAAARAVLQLYRAYRGAQVATDALSSRLEAGDDAGGASRSSLPSEEVSDLLQQHMNYFPALEERAEQLRREAGLGELDRFGALVRHLARACDVRVEIARSGQPGAALRRFDPRSRVLALSELLPTRSRLFQLAAQVALIAHADVLDGLGRDPLLTSAESRALARVALANYFAAAVWMPYAEFLRAAEELRYDIDVLGRRFGVGFEQTCHRLTTLRRPGHEGVPFHMVRIDVAGNISKRFSASGIRFARYAGVCPRWNIFSAFQTPNMIRVQVSRMPDGASFFCIARTIQKDSGGYHAQQPVQAIGLGCAVEHGPRLVYSDGIDLHSPGQVTPVGVTCRLCERTACEQRALPSLKVPLRVDPNYRGLSLYAPPPGE